MDALKRVLHILHLEPKMFYRLKLASPWGVSLAASHRASFHVVDQGECWLHLGTHQQTIRLCTGDLIVVSNVADYCLLDTPTTPTIPLHDALKYRDAQGIVRLEANAGAPPSATLICGEFSAENDAIYPLFSLLPPLIVVPGEAGLSAEWLATALKFITTESTQPRPGSETVISRLMDILFIMVIRYWIEHQAPNQGGWLGALYHPQLGEVLGYIHQQPEQDWSVESLAAAVNMGRSTLAAQFTSIIGEPPMKYLTRWRMQVAVMWLASERYVTIEEIAARVGYTSPYAFSKAFKRLVGIAPTDYRRKFFGKKTPA
jgi:AraC-like DNA-binding protein